MVRRKELRSKGFCDYCVRTGYTPTCKFPQRHNKVAPKVAYYYKGAQKWYAWFKGEGWYKTAGPMKPKGPFKTEQLAIDAI